MNKKSKTYYASWKFANPTYKQLKLINNKLEALTEKMINDHARNMKQLLELSVCLKNLEAGGEALDFNTTLLK